MKNIELSPVSIISILDQMRMPFEVLKLPSLNSPVDGRLTGLVYKSLGPIFSFF